MTYRSILIAAVLVAVTITPTHAVIIKNPLTGGPGGGVLYQPPPTWVPPPDPPIGPVVTGRECFGQLEGSTGSVSTTARRLGSCSISIGWWNTGARADTNTCLHHRTVSVEREDRREHQPLL